MIPNVLSSMPFKAPTDPNNAEGRRAILEILRAADNDNPPPPRADAYEDRAALLKPEFAPRRVWLALRELAESSELGSNWRQAPAGVDDGTPTAAEASVERLWGVDQVISAAHDGVDFKELGGRIIPYGGRAGALIYSEATGRLVRCGRLVIADDSFATYEPPEDNDNRPKTPGRDDVEIKGGVRRATETEDDPNGPAAIDVLDDGDADEVWYPAPIRGLPPRAGTITKIWHTKKDGAVIQLHRPRKPNGSHRPRKTEPPAPLRPASMETAIDAKQRLQHLEAKLTPATVSVLDYSIYAPNFEAIGEMLGHAGEYARKAGRRALVKACKELDAALKQNSFYYAA